MAKRTQISTLERFFDKVEKVHSGCWEWRGGVSSGYGQFWFDGRVIGAHRASWRINFGEIPDDHDVCHRCDNTLCVRPSHLFVGTAQENLDDMTDKGRRFYKLDDAAVSFIIKSDKSTAELAEQFNVTMTRIRQVRGGVRVKTFNPQ